MYSTEYNQEIKNTKRIDYGRRLCDSRDGLVIKMEM